MSATVQYEKDYRRDIQYITHGGASMAALETYVNQLAPFSNAAITRLSITQAKVIALPSKTGEYIPISTQAKLLVRDTDTGDLWGIMIPCPLAFMVEEVENEGYRVKQAIGEQITGYYAQYSGLNLTFDSGWLVGGR
jgi:hypothetical protein